MVSTTDFHASDREFESQWTFLSVVVVFILFLLQQCVVIYKCWCNPLINATLMSGYNIALLYFNVSAVCLDYSAVLGLIFSCNTFMSLSEA